MSDHLGERAALYALGALDDRERNDVDTHVVHCSACVRLLAQAEADVSAIGALEPQLPAPIALDVRVDRLLAAQATSTSAPRWYAPFASVAAALLIAILPTAYFWHENTAMHHSMVADAELMHHLAVDPHRTIAFAGSPAKVMYAPDGSWYCVMVPGTHAPMRVSWIHDGQATSLGMAQPQGDMAVLYLPKSHRMNQLALSDGTHVVAEAQLVF